ncbi:MAG: Cof-type HAD-IIB family hydrolase [Clostridiales bacterium]|nr:Cof-type HAD-IIB family hydrolase [Clostridiales bacterium]
MIKFIASDLDGTLLDENKNLPEEIFDLIEKLSARGVLFSPASGRQYANLRKLFAPVADKVVFICENGALVKYREETLYCNPVDDADAEDAIRKIRALPHLYPMLCGTDFAYIENNEMPFFKYAMASYTNCKKVSDLIEVIGREDCCKIAVYDEIAAAENCIKVLPKRLPKLRTILSGFDWCDVSAPTANKGEAMRFIRSYFHFKKEECVSFGDHMNDYEMLLESGRAYVPENAYPPLKRMIRRTVPANNEGGVLTAIKKFLSGETL